MINGFNSILNSYLASIKDSSDYELVRIHFEKLREYYKKNNPLYGNQFDQLSNESATFNQNEKRSDKLGKVQKYHNKDLDILLSSIPNLVYFKDKNLKFIMVSHSFESWINKKANDIIGLVDDKIYPKYLQRKISTIEKEVLESGSGVYNIEEELIIDDTPIWFHTSVLPYRNERNEVIGIITSSLDITNIKKHEIELEESHQKAQKALNIKNEFLANMSHELRTPMHGIAGSLEIIDSKVFDDETQHLIKSIKQSNDQLLMHINNMILYSKSANNELEIKNESFNLRELLDETISNSRKKAESKGLEIRGFFDERINPNIISDRVNISKLIDVFLSNSIKFTDKGFIHFLIKKIKVKDDKVLLKFELFDTGIGIANNKKNEIFDLFSTGDSSTQKKYSGTGLGLSLAKNILNNLNAKYGFNSKEHAGSHFWFEIEVQMVGTEKQKQNLSRNEVKILLVEDNLVNQKIAFVTLQKMGFPVDIAENGEEALEMFKHDKYKLVLMDIQMPVMDGYEAAKKIREYEQKNSQNLSSLIIALSANVLPRDIQLCFDAGMDEFVGKPFTSAKLLDKMKLYFNFKD